MNDCLSKLAWIFLLEIVECLIKGLCHDGAATDPDALEILSLDFLELLADPILLPSDASLALVALGQPDHQLELRIIILLEVLPASL